MTSQFCSSKKPQKKPRETVEARSCSEDAQRRRVKIYGRDALNEEGIAVGGTDSLLVTVRRSHGRSNQEKRSASRAGGSDHPRHSEGLAESGSSANAGRLSSLQLSHIELRTNWERSKRNRFHCVTSVRVSTVSKYRLQVSAKRLNSPSSPPSTNIQMRRCPAATAAVSHLQTTCALTHSAHART